MAPLASCQGEAPEASGLQTEGGGGGGSNIIIMPR